MTAATNATLLKALATVSCATRDAWFRDMTPIEPIRFNSGAAPTALLFQIARFDTAILLADARAVYDAASSPKEVPCHATGHTFDAQVLQDRYDRLAEQLGMDP